MEVNEYKCAKCENVFEKGWSDEEADKEREAMWGVPQSDCVLVCDTCYKKLMAPYVII